MKEGKNMKKTLVILLALVMVFVLFACGSKEEVTPQKSEEEMAKEKAMAETVGEYLTYDRDEVGGTYVRKAMTVDFKADGTGSMSFQDNVTFTWDDKEVVSSSGAKYTYVHDGNYVTLTGDLDYMFHKELPKYTYSGTDQVEKAVYEYISSIGSNYSEAEVSIPEVVIVAKEEDGDTVKVYGVYYVYNYDLDKKVLYSVSGGAHPGMVTLKKSGSGYEAVGLDEVEDGSNYTSSAKKIFGNNYEAFIKANSDDSAKDAKRKEEIKAYVKANSLDITGYQDYGWDVNPL